MFTHTCTARTNLRLFSWLCIRDFFPLSKSHSRSLFLSESHESTCFPLSLSFFPSFSLITTHTQRIFAHVQRIFALQRNFVQLSVGSRVHASHPVNDTPIHSVRLDSPSSVHSRTSSSARTRRSTRRNAQIRRIRRQTSFYPRMTDDSMICSSNFLSWCTHRVTFACRAS